MSAVFWYCARSAPEIAVQAFAIDQYEDIGVAQAVHLHL